MRGVVVALSGASGSGKSTVARALARAPGWVRLEEAFDRLDPTPDLAPASQADLKGLELRLLAEEGRRYRESRDHLLRGRSVIADTSFLDPVAYTAGLLVAGEASPATFLAVASRAEEMIGRGQLGMPDLTCYLLSSRATRQRRASQDPRRHPTSLRARHELVGRFEASVVRACLARGARGRVVGVRATEPPEALAERLRRGAAQLTPIRGPGAAALRAVQALLRHRTVRAALGRSGNLKRATPSPRPPR